MADTDIDVMVIEEEVVIDEKELEKQRNQAVATCYDWYEKDRNAKQWYVEEMEEMYKLYNGDHWSVKGPKGHPLRTDEQKLMRPNAVENVTFALVEGLVAEFSQDLDLVDFPVEKGDEEAAKQMTEIKKFLAHKNRINWERQKWLRYFFLYGNGIWHTYWDPSWTGGRGPNRWNGDIRWEALHPQTLFPDARCGESLEDGRRVHKAVYRTLEEIRENYPEHGQRVQADVVSGDMLVGKEPSEETADANDEQALLVETWYKGEPLYLAPGEENHGPGLHVIWWAGDGQNVYLNHANYVYFDPGEDARFPFIIKPCYPRENSVWGYGEPYFIKNQQIILNKTSEMIIEGHMHHALGQTVYAEDAVNRRQKKDIEEKGTIPGMWLPVDDVTGIQRLHGSGVPASLQHEMERLQKSMETTIGRFDISQGRAPGSVTAFRALDLLSARAQVRLRSKEMAMTASYEDVGKYINNLITKFYTERRAYRIIGKPNTEGEQVEGTHGVYRPEDFLRVYVYDTGDIIPKDEFVPLETMQEGEDYEVYSPEFDVICSVSTTLPTDRLFYMDMAKELFAGQVIGAETFWYVMENGKFPPFEKMREEAKEMQEMQDEMQAQMIEAQMGGGEEGEEDAGVDEEEVEVKMDDTAGALSPEGDTSVSIETILEQNPELAEMLENLPSDEAEAIIREYIAQVEGGETGG